MFSTGNIDILLCVSVLSHSFAYPVDFIPNYDIFNIKKS